MTNSKMPRVGEKYKNKQNEIFIVDFIYLNGISMSKPGNAIAFQLDSNFYNEYELIPQDPISQPEKEERLPEVGVFNKYAGKKDGSTCIIYDVITSDKEVILGVGVKVDLQPHFKDFMTTKTKKISLNQFWEEFEEIPNNSQEPSELDIGREIINSQSQDGYNSAWSAGWAAAMQSKRHPEVQVKESILSDEVRGAMEGLREGLDDYIPYDEDQLREYMINIKNKSRNLLNALESMVKSNIPEKGDCGIVKDAKHPIQPIILDDNGFARFKENKIVSYLLDKTTEAKICDLNQIAILVAQGVFNKEDQVQLTQLIGYSVSGAGDLSYMPKAITEEVDRKVENLINNNKTEEEKKSEESSFKHAKNCSCQDMGNNTTLPCRACVTETINEAMKEGEEEKPKSIWRDVSELPEEECQVIVSEDGKISLGDFILRECFDGKYKMFLVKGQHNTAYINGKNFVYGAYFTGAKIKWCLLTDFINRINSLEQRINKLEGK